VRKPPPAVKVNGPAFSPYARGKFSTLGIIQSVKSYAFETATGSLFCGAFMKDLRYPLYALRYRTNFFLGFAEEKGKRIKEIIPGYNESR
jgi:hypothetical protein